MKSVPTALVMAMVIAGSHATPISICRDATYDITGAICSGAGSKPAGIACPRKGDRTTRDCHPNLPSYDHVTQTCIAIEDASCVIVNGDTWGCAYPSIPCGSAPVLCSTPTTPCPTWEYSEDETPSEIKFDATTAPASWFQATGPLPQYQVGCLDGSPVKPLVPPTPAPTQPTPAPSQPMPSHATVEATGTPKPQTGTPTPAPTTPNPTPTQTLAPITPSSTSSHWTTNTNSTNTYNYTN
uniref:Secreted protein n=1 Tax=Thraustotheca clavata TaxID=74557 RepID=A0A0A7CMF7_9STRA|nr:secreted protein [Thraustotheca clavata]